MLKRLLVGLVIGIVAGAALGFGLAPHWYQSTSDTGTAAWTKQTSVWTTNSLALARMPTLLARAKPRLAPASITRTPGQARAASALPSPDALSTTTIS